MLMVKVALSVFIILCVICLAQETRSYSWSWESIRVDIAPWVIMSAAISVVAGFVVQLLAWIWS